MVRSLIIGSAASIISLLMGGPLIALLERFGIRKAISDEGPESHMAKAGTPTMGGLLMLIIILMFTIPTNLAGHRSILLPLGVMGALLLAVLLNQQIKGIAIFRCAYYLTHILGGVGTILIWQWLFNPDVGFINVMLQSAHGGWAWLAGLFGLEVAAWAPPRWLHSPQWCKPALVLMHLWGSGGAMLIFLAALQNVPERLYEAARLDGAGRWRRFRHVTLPQISPVILFNFVVGLIGAVRVFRPAYVLRHWSQDDGLLFYMVYVYENAFEDPARLGFASALTWILFVVLFALTLLTVVISRRWVHYED